jgi:hypothetical protein
VKVVAMTQTTYNSFNETHRVSCLRENLTSSSDGEGLETGCALSSVPRQSFTRQNWWKWVKQMFKVKRPLGNSENALPVQIVSAFVTDLLLRAFKHSSGFTSSLYEFVSNCQEFSLVPLKELTNGALRRALETILKLFDDTSGVKRPLQLAA